MQKYQHKIPQGVGDEGYHEEEPRPAAFGAVMICLFCGKPLVKVDENEGPESLKSMLRF